MVLYSCPRCGYNSNLKANLKRHFLKKRTCSVTLKDVPIQKCLSSIGDTRALDALEIQNNALGCVGNALDIQNDALGCVGNALGCVGNALDIQKDALDCVEEKKSYKCYNCNKTFKHIRYLKQHESRYNCLKKNKISNIEETPPLLDNKDIIISELKNQIEVLLTKVGNTTNNTNNTINISINAYGNENIDYITSNIINKLIQVGPYKSIPRLLKHIHFNPKHKENHNIRIPNRKEKYAKIYNGDRWELRDKKETIEDLSDRAYNLLEDHYDGGNKHMDKFIDEYEDDENTTKKVYKETELMILNNQNLEEV